ncbi:MAG: restriction endonuclease subunit S [Kiritimatiellae bacterium]|nr:restriction endonuclease subunit S [Kiritimatiellia bacterium]
MVKINSIAEIRMGITLRGRDATRAVENGSCRLVRISDVSQDGTWLNADFAQIEPAERIREEQFLRSGDVLFPNRGTRTTAIVFRLDTIRTIAGAQFFVLRPEASRVLPEYLAWFLRTEESARHFEGRRKGTYVQIVERRDLEELELPLPPLEVQRKIVDVACLAVEERILGEKLATLKARLVAGELLGAARGGERHGDTDTRTNTD